MTKSNNTQELKYFNYCRFCFSKKVEKVIDLGKMPLAGGFLKNLSKQTLENEKFYPLELVFCKKCFLLQTNSAINRDLLFKNYFYHSSVIKTLVDFFNSNIEDVKSKFLNPSKTFIVEIGCNDGYFVKSLINNGYQALGIDPAKNIVKPLIKKGLPIINDYFSQYLAKKIKKDYGKVDAIYSFNTFAHIENMHDVIKGIKLLLKPEGILAFQVHYLGSLIKGLQYDMIYHEHQYYYSLLTLQKFFSQYDMEIFDIKFSKLHGGSIMYYVQNEKYGKNTVSKKVFELLKGEKTQGLNKAKMFYDLSYKIKKQKKILINLLTDLKSKKKKIVGYGASGRATIIMNYCGIDKKYLDYIVDDSKHKHNNLTPGTHLKVYPSSKLRKSKPDYVLLFAWSFINEVKKRNIVLKNKVKFIVPLPKVKIISV